MKLLLDTCAFLWLATEPARLSKTAVDAIDDEANERLLAAQAIGGPFRFITVDKIFDDLGVDRLW